MAILISNKGLNGRLKISGNSTGGFKARYVPPPVIDADAQAFFDRVTAAGGTLSATEQSAVNTLVISMKAVNVWTPMKAIYPMVGASTAACAQNLKSSSFTGIFSNGWIITSTGITPNGTSAYLDTGVIPSINLLQNSTHLSSYIRGTNTGNQIYIGARGASVGASTYLLNYGFVAINNSDAGGVGVPGQVGLFANVRTSATNLVQYKNTTALSTLTVTSVAPGNRPIYIGAYNSDGAASNFSNNQTAFASIGDGLSTTQQIDFYSAVQAFQTTLGRQV